MKSLEIDIAIVGAGIAGLWLLNRLSQAGYSCLLLEKNSIGCGQTLHSQGIIHGGTKYALKGKLTKAASEVAQMTQVWSDCLKGNGEIDLSSAEILSQHHYLWTRAHFGAGLKSFVSSQVLASQSDVIKPKDYPEAFKNKAFHGSLCRLQETVWNVPDLVRVLAQPYLDRIIKTDDETAYEFEGDRLSKIRFSTGVEILPEHTIFTAAKGNEALLQNIPNPPQMQLRPLHEVYLKQDQLPKVYAHCVDKGTKPRVTITTHQAQDGQMVWYLGGDVAETGVNRTKEAQIEYAQKELADIVPWVDISNAQWNAFLIDRAEGAMPGGKRPDSPVVHHRENFSVVWPTKLTLAPMVAHGFLKHLTALAPQRVMPDLSVFTKAPMGKVIWDHT